MNINKIDQFRYLLPEDHQVKKQVTIKIRQAAQLIVLYDDGTHFYYRAKAHLKVHQMLQTLFKYIVKRYQLIWLVMNSLINVDKIKV